MFVFHDVYETFPESESEAFIVIALRLQQNCSSLEKCYSKSKYIQMAKKHSENKVTRKME